MKLRKFLLFERSGIHFRFLALIACLSVALVSASLFSGISSETRHLQNKRNDAAVAVINQIVPMVGSSFDENKIPDFKRVMEDFASGNGKIAVTIIDRGERHVLVNDRDFTFASGFKELPAVKFNNVVTVSEQLVRNETVSGSVLVQYSGPRFIEVGAPIIISGIMLYGPAIILALVVASVLAGQITAPLSRIGLAAKRVSAGKYQAEVPVEGPREIRHLGKVLNTMVSMISRNAEEVHELAFTDRTTQLPNREFFRREMEKTIQDTITQGTHGAMLFMDLDGFKKVNDTHGHDVGDILLRQFSDRVKNVLRKNDAVSRVSSNSADKGQCEGKPDTGNGGQMLARLGGDEFTILLPKLNDEADAAGVSSRIIEAASKPFMIAETEVIIGASIGIAIFPRDGADYDGVVKSADMAMYQAKQEGKNTYRFYSEELNEEASGRMRIETDLRAALATKEQFELYYQPKIDCKTGRPASVEAFVRWQHPELGLVNASRFIPIAEDCGLILPLGRWVLEQACMQLQRFRTHGIDLSIAVNVTTTEFEQHNFPKIVMDILSKTGADPAKLGFELTESLAMRSPEKVVNHIEALKGAGMRFAIDDFGTGYSNLSQLSRLPIDVFKIDSSFVKLLANRDDEHGRIIVRTILSMANSLNYETVASGVETISQVEFLSEYGCNFAQGHYFSRPMPENQFIDWYAGWKQKDDAEVAQMLRQGVAA